MGAPSLIPTLSTRWLHTPNVENGCGSVLLHLHLHLHLLLRNKDRCLLLLLLMLMLVL
jgi:hypothetical protein